MPPAAFVARESWRDGAPHEAPEVHDGVSCVVCHQIANVDLSQPNAPGIFAGVVTMSRPTDPLESVMYGVLGDVGFSVPGQMRAAYNPQLRCEICAACHQDANDPDGDNDFEEDSSVISEPTSLEWLASDYGDPASPLFAECIDCHMPADEATLACNQFLDYFRTPGTLRSHTIEGTSARFLENAVTLTIESEVAGDELSVNVAIVNDNGRSASPSLFDDPWEGGAWIVVRASNPAGLARETMEVYRVPL